jgi:hypothetical protein
MIASLFARLSLAVQEIRIGLSTVIVQLNVWGGALNALGSILGTLRDTLGRVIGALKRLSWGRIWRFLHSIFDKLHRAIQWYRVYVLGPLERMRAQILDLYRKLFRPIIQILDTLRVGIRVIGIFNRRLAAALDARLWKLESKLLYPITEALHRLNRLSSYVAALITRAGLLDRSLLLESLRRDASLVWEVLTNPRAALHAAPAPGSAGSIHQVQQDVHIFVTSGGGPMADYVDAVHQVALDTIGGLS